MKKGQKIALGTLSAIAIIAICGSIFAYIQYQSNKKEPTAATSLDDRFSDRDKKILGIGQKDDNTDSEQVQDIYSEEYKKYLELSDEEKDKLEVVPRKIDPPSEVIDEIGDEQQEEIDSLNQDEKKQEQVEQLINIPSSFNLKEIINLPIRDQRRYGLCWDFATLLAVESFAKLHGYDENLDLSELYLDYALSKKMYGDRKLHDGGSFTEAERHFAHSGLIDETTGGPYPEIEEDPYHPYGKKDAEILELFSATPTLNVTKTIDFPNYYSLGSDEEKAIFRDTVKRHIMLNGALYFSAQAPIATTTIYCNGNSDIVDCNMNPHAMAIVGWDDNYPVQKWIDEHGGDTENAPKHDGAYIVQNSLGEQNGENGIYYYYYDDIYVGRNISGILSLNLDDALDLNTVSNQKLHDKLYQQYRSYIKEVDGKQYLTPVAIKQAHEINLDNLAITSSDLEQIATIIENTYIISLKNNNISDLSFIKNANKIYYLDLSGNPINTISPDFFTNSSIDTFHCNDCHLSGNLTIANSNIVNLSLDNNPDIQTYSISGTPLYYISLVGNNLKEASQLNIIWPKNDDYETTATIDISNNPNFSDYNRLPDSFRDITAKNNSLTDLTSFSGNTHVKMLDVSENLLTSINGLPSEVSYLDVSDNPSLSDYSAINNLTIYETPDVSEDDEYYYCDYSCERLSLIAKNNNIDSLGIFGGINEQITLSLNLANNKIKELSYIPLSTHNLTVSNNLITTIGDFNAPSLEFISLNNSPVESGIEHLKDVSFIDLSGTKITDISSLIETKSGKISSLDLSRNNITEPLHDIGNLSNLYSLSVSDMKTPLTGELASESLEGINLSGSDINDLFINTPNTSWFNLDNIIADDEKINHILESVVAAGDSSLKSFTFKGIKNADINKLFTTMRTNQPFDYSQRNNNYLYLPDMLFDNDSIDSFLLYEDHISQPTTRTLTGKIEDMHADTNNRIYAKDARSRAIIAHSINKNCYIAPDASYLEFYPDSEPIETKLEITNMTYTFTAFPENYFNALVTLYPNTPSQ